MLLRALSYLLLSTLALSGCNRNPDADQDPANLMTLADATEAGTCPNLMCPVGTKIYFVNGKLVGDVVEVNADSTITPGVKGMRVQKKGQEWVTTFIPPAGAKVYFILR